MKRKFKKIYIEITNICNLSCEFCPKTARKAQFMDKSMFEAILTKIKGYSEHLYFHVMGEPLLHPEIGHFLELCGIHGFRVNVTTNGTLVEKASDSIISKPALRQVNFSLHSFEANARDYTLDSYLDGIFKFINRACKERQLLISLRLWNLSDGGKNRENKYILERIRKAFGLDYELEDKLASGRGIKLAENIFLNQAPRFDWPDINREHISDGGFCYGLRDQVAILVDGTVVPCCLDGEGRISLGNILERDFDDILNSKRARDIYEGFSGRKAVEELCRKCGYRMRFGG